MKSFPASEPFGREELRRDLGAVRGWAGELWESFAAAEFFAPLGEAWSPADNVRHLVKSNRPVAGALRFPKAAVLLRFGPTWRPSRSSGSLRSTYQEALGAGLQAGRFAPRPLEPAEQNAAERRRILDEWSASLVDLAANLESWSERALDRLRLPHPGLGLLTVREMILFTIYHNVHHASAVAERTAAARD
jgi:hypothetical protein